MGKKPTRTVRFSAPRTVPIPPGTAVRNANANKNTSKRFVLPVFLLHIFPILFTFSVPAKSCEGV